MSFQEGLPAVLRDHPLAPGRALGHATLFVVGCSFVVSALLHVLYHDQNAQFADHLGTLGLLSLSLPVFAAVLWLQVNEYTDSEVWTVVGWCFVGAVATAVLAVFTVFYQAIHDIGMADVPFVVVGMAGIGTGGGILTGMYDVHHGRSTHRHRSTAQQLAATFEASPVAIVSLDGDGIVERWNKSATEMFGWSSDEIIGEPYPLVPEDRREQFERRLERTRHGEALSGVETIHHRKDGFPLHVSMWSAPVADEDERTRTMLVLVDITKRRERERYLRMFRRAIEQTGNAVMITANDGTIEYVNSAFEETTGYDETEAAGQTPAIFKSGKHDDAFYADLWETILSGEEWSGEIVNQRKTGELYHVDASIAPIEDDEGEITHFAAVQTDITERKQREQRLQVFNRILRHNIRTAVTVINGRADLLAETISDPESIDHTESIKASASNLADLSTKAIRTRSLLEADTPDGEHCQASEILASHRDRFAARYPDATITLTVEEPVTVSTDPRLETAIDETIENAIEHNDSDTPQVDIVVTCDGTDARPVVITIADNGPGIPDQERRVIETGDETPLDHGSGLGLWLINWVISSLGGDIRIETPAGGTEVTIRLPAAEPL